eukprot:CAMPEP_0182424988 /NCGR_PEP_ID=MMETSP1167-20130531/11316_1 /TAXON_ID=2988 /ORGANISM="Mallomonas Sp, Strain CCMP3275" /LENGTH=156 /DNA_ID=CAMNT_0024605265 /DNA_START=132 /DNA_END=599 /DNA_ORIENTATION=+
MPVFDEDDEENLRRMTSGEDDWEMPDFSDNVPKKKNLKLPPKPKSPQQNVNKPTSSNTGTALPRKRSVPSPNLNWRSALSDTESVSRSVSDTKKKIPQYYSPTDISEVDLDYDDFERAMFEVEMGGMNEAIGIKNTDVPSVHQGLYSGDEISLSLW